MLLGFEPVMRGPVGDMGRVDEGDKEVAVSRNVTPGRRAASRGMLLRAACVAGRRDRLGGGQYIVINRQRCTHDSNFSNIYHHASYWT
jgi:hypothetical protein